MNFKAEVYRKNMSKKGSSHGRIPYFDDFVSFYQQSPLSFPATDIFCCGTFGPTKRLAALVNVLCMMRDQDKRFLVTGIVVVFPPIPGEALKNEESDPRGAVLDVMSQLQGKKVSTAQEEFLGKLLRVVRCSNLEVSTASALIESTEPHSILVFVDAAKYRQNGLAIERPTDSPPTMISEDVWVHHLRSFAERSVGSAALRSCYVVLDAGEASPYKPENAEILRKVEGCGVLGSRIVDDPREMVVAKLDGWANQIEAGLLARPTIFRD